ncbi:MAG: DNA repair protein RecO [Lachnospiraceae bacterium]|nr:DNA repair protein RecO [Lachnospiraceae bacterium]
MSETCTLTGMVLSAAPAGEYDKRITLLTKEQGKVTAFVRGARRPKSALQAATNLFCFGTFEAYEGRDAYTVVKADILNYFSELYTDPEKTWYGCYFLELAGYFTQPYCEASDQLKLLYQTVRALVSDRLDLRLIRRIYELKTLVYHGVSPVVTSCVQCGSKKDLHWFSLRRRGTLCGTCKGEHDTVLSDAALYTLQYIISSPIEKLYTFKVTEEVYGSIRTVIGQYLQLYVDREFKTLSLLPD